MRENQEIVEDWTDRGSARDEIKAFVRVDIRQKWNKLGKALVQWISTG